MPFADKFKKKIGLKTPNICETCGEKKKRCKCKSPSNSTESEDSEQAQRSEKEKKQFDSQHSVDGLSTIRASKHIDEGGKKVEKDVTIGKYEKTGLKFNLGEISKFEKDVAICRQKDTFSADGGKVRVTFTENSETYQCQKCGHESQYKQDKCEQCGSTIKDSALSQRSLRGRIEQHELNRRLTEKRKSSIFKRTKLLGGGYSIRAKDQRDIEFKNAKSLLNKIGKFCEKKKERFIDKSFPLDDDNDKWLSLNEIKIKGDDGSQWVMFSDAVSATDVKQGRHLDDCWFAAALCSLGERPDLIKKIIVSGDINEHGVYVLRLCKDGSWKTVLVDDRFPCNGDGSFKYQVTKGRKVVWPLLIQKAAAKLVNEYKNLNEGLIVEAMSMLTGEPCELIRLASPDLLHKHKVSKKERESLQRSDSNPGCDEERLMDAEDIWKKLIYSKEHRYLIGVSTPPEKFCKHLESFKDTGLAAEHSFAVLDVKEINGLRLIKLINPWVENKIHICLHNSCLKADTLEKVKDREFWITLEELMKYFFSVHICRVEECDEGSFEIRMKGVFPPSFNDPLKYYTFTVANPATEIHMELFQKNLRDRGPTPKENFNDMMIVVLQNHDSTGDEIPNSREPLFSKLICHSERKARSFVSCSATLHEGAYTVVCLAFKQLHVSSGYLSEEERLDLNKNFSLAIHSSSSIYGDEVDKLKYSKLKYAPADALILLAKQLCNEVKNESDSKYEESRRITELSGTNAKTYSLDWWGQILVLENMSEEKLFYVRDYSESDFVIASRGNNLKTSDVVPPKSCQVINVITAQMPDVDWTISAKRNHEVGVSRDIQHDPEITEDLAGTHSPRPIPQIN